LLIRAFLPTFAKIILSVDIIEWTN
jgi:hypothetical protein